MTQATVKYISNGYTITHTQIVQPVPEAIYAGSIPEVVYWLGRIFEPFAPAGFAAAPAGSGPGAAPAIIDNTDPLNNQLASVETIASGGFVVRQMGSIAGPTVDVWCVSMDAVANALTQIFTPPAAA